jgi:hypothetical protein
MFVCQAVIQQRMPHIYLFRRRYQAVGVYENSLLSSESACFNTILAAITDYEEKSG